MVSKLKHLIKDQGFQKYFRNTSWLFAEKVLRVFVGLIVGVWVARYLGPDQFGLFSYAQSLVGIFTAFATLGLDGVVVRDLVKYNAKQDLILGTTFVLKLIGAIGVLVVLSVFINFTSTDNEIKMLVFIIASSTVFHSFNVIDFYFQSKVLSKFVVFSNILSLILSSIIKILLIIFNAPLVAFAYMVLFESIILAFGFIYFYRQNELSIKTWKFNKEIAIALLKESWPLIISTVVISIYLKIDQVMINTMVNSEAVGQYAAAVKLSEAWYFIPTVIANSLFPAIVNAKKHSEQLYYSRIQKFFDVIVWIGIVIAIIMTYFSHDVIELLYGQAYNQAGTVLAIHIWSSVFIFLLVASGKWLINENLSKHALYRNTIGGIINIVLNIYLIKNYGIIGAAYATLISYAVAGLFYDIFSEKLRFIFYFKVNSLLLKSLFKGWK